MPTLMILLAPLVLSGPLSTGGSPRSGRVAHVGQCLVSIIDDVEVPATERGPLVSVTVKEGDSVQQNQRLAQIDDSQPQLDKRAAQTKYDAAIARASDDVAVRLAQTTHAVAAAELEQKENIRARSPGAASITEIRRLTLARDQTALEIDKARHELRVAKMEAEVDAAAVRIADAAIARRKIVSPIDGMVVAVKRQAGEWVDAGDPVVHVVRMDRLRVSGVLLAREYDPSEIANRPVVVEVELARGRRERFQGRIEHTIPSLQSGGRYQVWAVVENRAENGNWLLLPGATVGMAIELE